MLTEKFKLVANNPKYFISVFVITKKVVNVYLDTYKRSFEESIVGSLLKKSLISSSYKYYRQ